MQRIYAERVNETESDNTNGFDESEEVLLKVEAALRRIEEVRRGNRRPWWIPAAVQPLLGGVTLAALGNLIGWGWQHQETEVLVLASAAAVAGTASLYLVLRWR